MTVHAFDNAIALAAQADNSFLGHTSPAYGNMVGPFGGITAAQVMHALWQHPRRLGEPISLTVNFAAAVADGPFVLNATPVRTNRSTQHWQIDMVQAGDVVLTATAVTALRRSAWSANDAHRPVVASAMDVPLATMPFAVTWPQRYEMRPVAGLMPSVWDGHGSTSLSQMWVRDAPPRPLDFCALTAMADVFFPRIFLRRATRVPAGTVSMTVYFHADSAQLAATGTGYLLGQAQAQIFRNGFFDETGQLWNEAGDLLATMHQIVYYKE